MFIHYSRHGPLILYSFPPPFVTGKNAITWLYNGLAESWQTWLPNDTIPDIRRYV